MGALRAALMNPQYVRQVAVDRIPRGRRVYLVANASASWPASASSFIGEYVWEPTGPVGVTHGTQGESMVFTRPPTAGDPITIKVTDHDLTLRDQLETWFNAGTALRMFVQGEEWLTGYLIKMPSLRILPVEFEISFAPTRGARLTASTPDGQILSPFRTGSTSIFAVGSTTTFNVNDSTFADYIKTGDTLIIDRAGVLNNRTVSGVSGPTITISVAVTGLASGDQVSSFANFYGVFP